MEGFFWFEPPTPTPLEIHTFLEKFWPLRPPYPSEFPMTLCGGGMDIFWNHTI